MSAKQMTLDEAIERAKTRVLIDVWPETALLFDCGKATAYAMAKKGIYQTIRVGKLIKVPTAPLRRQLGI